MDYVEIMLLAIVLLHDRYDPENGWAEILGPLMAVPMTIGDRYNCFYTIMSKFALRDTSPNRFVL
jgi:hypothetical protein